MSESAGKAVFLSYASQDAAAVLRIADALRAAGVVVWFDQNELVGGDAWDAKIRGQIASCALFVPVISAATQARGEGYFRLEWKLAVDRSHLMAHDQPFLLPVVVDATADAAARVPLEFRAVQWTRLPGGEAGAAFVTRVRNLLGLDEPVARGSRPVMAEPAGQETRATESARRRVPIGAWIVAGVATLAVATAIFVSSRVRSAATPATATPSFSTPAPAPKSVAVLAFANVSNDPENEFFSDGIAGELLTILQKIPGLRVAAQTSSFSFKGKNATAKEVGEKLSMAHVVEGSVLKSGKSVKITARLIHAATNELIWTASYGPLELTDFFATQSMIAQKIVAGLRGLLTGENASTPTAIAAAAQAEIKAQVQAATKGGTKNPEAHQLYLQANFFLNQNTVPAAIRAAELLHEAIRLDSKFALAWVALAQAGWVRGGFGETKADFEEGFKLARESAAQALTIESDLASAHLALAILQGGQDFNWKAAAESVRRAQALAPNDPIVVARAAWLAGVSNQREKAVELYRQAVALDPVNPLLRIFFGYVYYGAGRFEEAKAEFQRVRELSPSAAWGHGGVSMVLTAEGRFDEAVSVAEQEKTTWCRLFAVAIARWGQKDGPASDAALAELIKTYADVAAVQVAWVYAFRGQNDLAFEWLERSYRQHDGGLQLSKTHQVLNNLHTDARWPVFLRKIGLHDDQLK